MGSPPDTLLLACITGAIQVGREQVSQVVLVQVDTNCSPDACTIGSGDVDGNATIMVKLYDPAYSCNTRDDEEKGVVERARKSCLKELEAYNELVKLQGEIVPRYYGKYVYRIIFQEAEETRDVHVLLEYFNGISLWCFACANQFHFLTATK